MSSKPTKPTAAAKGKTNASRQAAGCNWQIAQRQNQNSSTNTPAAAACNRKQHNNNNKTVGTNSENVAPAIATITPTAKAVTATNSKTTTAPLSKSARLRQKRQNKFVAIDCEMVGIGPNGHDDMLARVSIVNKQGEVLLDKYVKGTEKVVDYRTSVSGIRPHDIENGEDFDKVQDEVVNLLQGKILVGHGVRNDLAVLRIKHPYTNLRDTSRYKPLCKLIANGRTPSLKHLCQALLGIEIQTGEHNSVEDARAAMRIYNRIGADWERYIRSKRYRHGAASGGSGVGASTGF